MRVVEEVCIGALRNGKKEGGKRVSGIMNNLIGKKDKKPGHLPCKIKFNAQSKQAWAQFGILKETLGLCQSSKYKFQFFWQSRTNKKMGNTRRNAAKT